MPAELLQKLDANAIAAIAKELNQDLRDISQWLVKLAEAGGDIQNFYQRITKPVPAGSKVRFWVGNVDDEATLRCEGLFKKINRNDPAKEYFLEIGSRGKNVVILTLVNSGSLAYRVDLNMDVPGVGRVINLSDSGTDIPPYGLQRNYIFTFDVI